MELVREHTVHIFDWCWSEQAVCAVHVVSVPRCVIPSPLRAHETACVVSTGWTADCNAHWYTEPLSTTPTLVPPPRTHLHPGEILLGLIASIRTRIKTVIHLAPCRVTGQYMLGTLR